MAWDYCYFITAVDFSGNESDPTDWLETQTTGIDEGGVPTAFALHPCYPNPFNPTTKIRFDLPRISRVTLQVYDMSGRLVRVLVQDENFPPGRHEVAWMGRDEMGRLAAAGVYFYRLQADTFLETQRMTLVK
jgi:hypothetical protein